MSIHLGQHFLKDKISLEKIVEALNIERDDFIIEIGSGHGELTKEIRNQNLESKIIAIEKDKKMANFLKENLKNDKNIEIVEGNALKILPELIENWNLDFVIWKLVGNIPYYITSYLFRILAGLEPKPKIIVFTIQKEVAERIVCKNGMNLLAASIQFWAKPEIVGYIPKTAFGPQPKVDSVIIKLTPKFSKSYQLKAESYYPFIKILFKQPRKTILNNLRDTKNVNPRECREKLLKIGVNPNDRPQNLSIKQIISLSTLF